MVEEDEDGMSQIRWQAAYFKIREWATDYEKQEYAHIIWIDLN